MQKQLSDESVLIQAVSRQTNVPTEVIYGILVSIQYQGYEVVKRRTAADVHLPKFEVS